MQTYIYRGAIENLSLCLKNKKNILFFCGKSSWKMFYKILEPFLYEKNYDIYNDFSPNPKKEEILKALDKCIKSYDAIVSFGGGSVIDFAKAYRFYQKKNIPLIAIPTTAGTGSEATQFAVVYENGKKTSLDAAEILPDFSIVDSQFSEKAPQYIKACTAMDAFSQAIESFWAVQATKESLKYADEAIVLEHKHIEKAVLSYDLDANEAMMIASHLAGKAINISRTTAAHALSYTMTTRYGIPHGHAVALSMADLFRANFNITEETKMPGIFVQDIKEKMQHILHNLHLEKVEAFVFYWQNLMEKLGLKWKFSDLGIDDKTVILESVNLQRLKNNPKKLNEDLGNFWNE